MDTDFTMRPFVLAASTLALAVIAVPLAANPAQAVEYPYCASGQWAGGGGCSYATLEQCRASISGVGGSCVNNPRYTPNPNVAVRPPRARR
jgi:Protein of unknown function (DUF3551)